MDVVIYQVGGFPGLQQCLESIRFYSPKSVVHVLGDNIPFLAPTPIKPYSTFADKFASVYVHHSINPHEFELRCFQRWCVIIQYARAIGLSRFFCCDSDVLVFDDLELASKQWEGCQLTMPMGSSFIYDVRALELFVRFFMWYYQKPNSRLRLQLEQEYIEGKRSSISDMTLADSFLKVIKTKDAADWTQNIIVDPNIALINNYHSRDGQKRIYWILGRPYCVTEDNRIVRMVSVHCWGKAKTHMRQFLDEAYASL